MDTEKILAQIPGVINGKHIELAHETGLPPGSSVVVTVLPKPLSLEEKSQRVDWLCGAWADDDSLKSIFAEIERARVITMPREINFDATS